MGLWMLIGIASISIGLYIRTRSILLRDDNEKLCFKIVKTNTLKSGD